MDILVEILLEIYMELMMLIVPEKNAAKWMKTVATILAVVMLLVVFGLVVWGAIWYFDCGNAWGLVPLILAAVISLAQIVAGIILYKRHH